MQGGPYLSEARDGGNGKGWGGVPVMKVTTKEDGNPERRRRQSANEEDDDEGGRKSSNEEDDATTTISRRGRQRLRGEATTEGDGD